MKALKDVLENFDREDALTDLIKDAYSDIESIDKLSEEIDGLYNESKGLFDQVKNSRGAGTLTFLEKQTNNLTQLKVAKGRLLSDKFAIKKSIIDIKLKQTKSEDLDANLDNMAEKIASQLSKKFIDNKLDDEEETLLSEGTNTKKNKNKKKASIDDLLQQKIKDLSEEGKLNFTDNERAVKYENRPIKICIYVYGEIEDNEWKFIALDEDSKKIIKDYPLPSVKQDDVRFERIGKKIIAIDNIRRSYKVIKKKKK